jgi:hypothetical protein
MAIMCCSVAAILILGGRNGSLSSKILFDPESASACKMVKKDGVFAPESEGDVTSEEPNESKPT